MPQPGEPYWLDSDRQKALEWQADKRDHCPGCGQRRSDWRDEKGVELREPPFEVVKLRCPSCEMLDEQKAADDEVQKDPQAPKEHGVKYGFKRITDD